jgi:hypothetical protein
VKHWLTRLLNIWWLNGVTAANGESTHNFQPLGKLCMGGLSGASVGRIIWRDHARERLLIWGGIR